MGAFQGGNPLASFDSWLPPVLGLLRSTANKVIDVVRRIWRFLYDKFLKSILDALLHHKGKLWDVLLKVKTDIQRVLEYERRNFNLYVRPLLNFIQRLRGALLIFRLLHMKWAQVLDSRLSSMESQLVRLWLNVLATSNTILGYFDYFMNPFGLFRSGVFLWTAIKSIGQLIGAMHAAQSVAVGAADLVDGERVSHLLDRQQVINTTTLTAATGLQPDYATRQSAIWDRLASMGYRRSS